MKKYTRSKVNYLIGYLSEIIAILFLRTRGFTLVKHRYRNEVAEIDIIARKNHTILFGEVKFRSANSEHYINYEDCLKIYSASEYFLQNYSEFLSYQRVFKLFLLSKASIKIETIF